MACRRSGVQVPLAPPGQRHGETGSRSSGSKTGSKPLAVLPHLDAVAGIVHNEDLWQLCRDELTGVEARINGWNISGRWFGVVIGARRWTGELPRGETIAWQVIAAQLPPRKRRSLR
jgi:hypothetical protein